MHVSCSSRINESLKILKDCNSSLKFDKIVICTNFFLIIGQTKTKVVKIRQNFWESTVNAQPYHEDMHSQYM